MQAEKNRVTLAFSSDLLSKNPSIFESLDSVSCFFFNEDPKSLHAVHNIQCDVTLLYLTEEVIRKQEIKLDMECLCLMKTDKNFVWLPFRRTYSDKMCVELQHQFHRKPLGQD